MTVEENHLVNYNLPRKTANYDKDDEPIMGDSNEFVSYHRVSRLHK